MCSAEQTELAYSDAEQSQLITKPLKNTLVYGNLLLGAAELLAGQNNSLSVTVDGVHNATDGITYNMQGNDILNHHDNIGRLQRRRKVAHWMIAASSAAVGMKAGLDLHYDVVHESSTASMYVAGASLLFNGALFSRLRQNIRHRRQELGTDIAMVRERDLTKHFMKLDLPSSVLAVGGILAQRQGFDNLEQMAAMISAGLGMWHFRPSRHNLHIGPH